MQDAFHIRPATSGDLPALETVAQAMGDRHEGGYFTRCLAEQSAGKRLVLLALGAEGGIAGYAQLIWKPEYSLFRRLDIPEIQDLNVTPDWRRRGCGALLVEACEERARAAGKVDIGISVGLYPRYGAAQRLYVRKGYVPDGAGVFYDDLPVNPGDMRPIDDKLTLKLVKSLQENVRVSAGFGAGVND